MGKGPIGDEAGGAEIRDGGGGWEGVVVGIVEIVGREGRRGGWGGGKGGSEPAD